MDIVEEYIAEKDHYLEDLEYSRTDRGIEIHFTKPNVSLTLDEKNLNDLLEGNLIDKGKCFSYYSHFGFSYMNYAEFFIGNDSNFLYGLYGYNTRINLSFKISEFYVEVNVVSELCVILLETYYSNYLDYVADRGLTEYFYTIKIYDAPTDQHKDLFIKALYYLNSYYLSGVESFVGVYHVLSDDYNTTSDDSDFDKVVNIEQKRTISRKDFISIEPIILFNHALVQSLENRFLCFYRILEFFFNRSLEQELKKLRLDPTVSEKEIIQTIQRKDERHLLKKLLNNVLTDSEKKRMVAIMPSKYSVEKDKFNSFCNKLYDYRNSLVHAKEYQLDVTSLPDLFSERKRNQFWDNVIRKLAKTCIARLNTK